MKKALTIAPWVIICILLLLYLLPDKQHDTHASDNKEVIAINDTLKAHDAISARVIDSLTHKEAAKDSMIEALKEGQAATNVQLKLKTSEAKNLAKEIQRHNKDTGEQARRIDSLVEKIESLTFLLVQYEQYADSLNLTNDSLRATGRTKDSVQDKRYAELKAAYDNLFKAYQELFADAGKMMKDLRRQKLKTKVAAVLGLLGAGLSIVK